MRNLYTKKHYVLTFLIATKTFIKLPLKKLTEDGCHCMLQKTVNETVGSLIHTVRSSLVILALP